MTQLLTTLRHQDLIHSQAEVARQTERIAGVSELPPTQIQPWGWGFLLTGLDASKQPWRWLDTERIVRRYLADTVEVGEFGVDAVVSHAIAGIPAGRYVGICHWLNRSTAQKTA